MHHCGRHGRASRIGDSGKTLGFRGFPCPRLRRPNRSARCGGDRPCTGIRPVLRACRPTRFQSRASLVRGSPGSGPAFWQTLVAGASTVPLALRVRLRVARSSSTHLRCEATGDIKTGLVPPILPDAGSASLQGCNAAFEWNFRLPFRRQLLSSALLKRPGMDFALAIATGLNREQGVMKENSLAFRPVGQPSC
ncbi:hypothetical protein SAMN02927900_05297 [Rhizobium mongolense subsp. loessense]|uniref:Uncharacterized protein n=1 Tax=Rhizobium mongolense subsp. loessense TaxID=158890 RepID=A0A1G4TL61_9HYPH|nr:hypothetical protein SAMN02927900_05297 [Rhizobium mongolense subsp. loessense]